MIDGCWLLLVDSCCLLFVVVCRVVGVRFGCCGCLLVIVVD